MQIINRVSSEAVRKATGKTWDEWLDLLDAEGAGKMDHKAIVRLMEEKGLIDSAWWRQQVTVGYEIARGKRVKGQTSEAGFEVGVQKTLRIPAQRAWSLITSPEGIRIWLGNAPRISLKAGAKYRTPDGTTGEIRTVEEGRRIRLTWVPRDWKHATTLQVTLLPRGEKTSINIHHERLTGERERERMQSHWRHVLEQMEELAVRAFGAGPGPASG